MIGTDENRAVLYVEVIFWSGKRKTPPSLMSGKYCPHFVVKGTTEYLGVCFLDGDECAFDEPALGNAQPLYPDTIVPFPVSWTVKMKKKQKETQDILSYHTQAAGCSDKARAKASGGRQPIEECGRTGL